MVAVHKEVGIVGLGDMGSNIARLLQSNGYSLVLYNRTKEKYSAFMRDDAVYCASDIDDFVKRLGISGNGIRIWFMLPPGTVTNQFISEISAILPKNSIIIDGSNSFYGDSIANYKMLADKGIHYLDVGCAGGPDDISGGTSLMIGGDMDAFNDSEDIFKALTTKGGTYGYLGRSGSGHMVKLVHNEIFYATFPAYAEAIELMLGMNQHGSKDLKINEALRLLSESRPINGGIMKAITEALEKGSIPDGVAPEMKVSALVESGAEHASDFGVEFSITRKILEMYSSMSDNSRRIYSKAKHILTGH